MQKQNNNSIIQLGNIYEEKGFKNTQTGRVYSIFGIAPTLNTCGGGQREPKILIYNELKA